VFYLKIIGYQIQIAYFKILLLLYKDFSSFGSKCENKNLKLLALRVWCENTSVENYMKNRKSIVSVVVLDLCVFLTVFLLIRALCFGRL
jgi:hypothetical protein